MARDSGGIAFPRGAGPLPRVRIIQFKPGSTVLSFRNGAVTSEAAVNDVHALTSNLQTSWLQTCLAHCKGAYIAIGRVTDEHSGVGDVRDDAAEHVIAQLRRRCCTT